MMRAWHFGLPAAMTVAVLGCSAASPSDQGGADETDSTGSDTTAGGDTSGTSTGSPGGASAGTGSTDTGNTSATGSTGATGGASTTGTGTTASGSTTSGTGLDPTDPSVHHFVAGGYYVDGPGVYDATGKPHMFHGLDRPSLEWAPAGQDLSSQNYVAIKGWGANVVRLSLNETYWNGNQSGYQNTVKTQVTQIEQNGMDVILDLHRTPGGGTTPDNQQCMPDQGSVTFWSSVAAAYKSDPHVLFELYNEPQMYNNWGFWLNGGPVTSSSPGGCEFAGNYTAVGMQALYTAVRGAGALNIVLLDGINYAYDLTFATSPGYAIKDMSSPYGDQKGFNIMFAAHPYNKPADNKTPDNWDNFFGQTAAKVPVILTEFGDLSSCSGSFNQQVITYADAHNIHWTAWAWWNAGCSFPSLVTDVNSGNPTEAGMPVKTALQGYH